MKAGSVPILIVGGDLDSLTPLLDAPGFGPRLGENVEIVPLRNTVHVTSQGGDLPGRGNALRADGDPLVPARDADSACAAAIPALHTPAYAPDARDARLRAGPRRGRPPRATIGVQAFADAVFRRYYSGVDRRPGPARRHVHRRGDASRCATSASLRRRGQRHRALGASTGGARVERRSAP